MSGEKAKGQVKKSKLWDNTYPLSAHPHPDELTTPNLCHPTIIHKKNTMDTEFLVQMRQSNKCGSVRNHEIFNLHFGSGEGPGVSISCLLQDTSHIYWFHPPQTVNQNKRKKRKNETQLSRDGIVLPGAMYTEPRAKTGRLGTHP